MKKQSSSMSVQKMVTMAMLVALSVIFTAFIRIRGIFPAASFLEYHAGDIPILLGSFLFGPLVGVVMSFLQTMLQALLLGASNGFVGWVMNFLAGGMLAFVVGFVYKKGKQTTASGILALLLGAIAMTTVMIGWNLIITPWYYGWPTSEVVKILLPGIVPFNLLRSILNTGVALTVYKAIYKYISKFVPFSVNKGKH